MLDKWKLTQPAFASEPEKTENANALAEAAIQNGEDLFQKRFAGEVLHLKDDKALDICGCVFEKCIFQEMDLKRISFTDCVFDKCEWSNTRLINATFQRASFLHCRMTGMEMMQVVLSNVLFENCMMDYVSFSEVKLDRVVLNQCRMLESLWNEVRFLKACFQQCDLSRAQWIRTSLKGIDMSTSQIDAWTIALQDLRGVKVTAAQMISLSGLLGVEIIP